MNQIKQIKLLKMDRWLLDQLEKPESAASRFFWSFLQSFIWQNLDQPGKNQFLALLAGNKTDQIMPFISESLPGFEKDFALALGKKLAQIKKILINHQ